MSPVAGLGMAGCIEAMPAGVMACREGLRKSTWKGVHERSSAVGIRYPVAGPGVDFNQPNRVSSTIAFFDSNGNGRADPREIRLYDSSNGYQVECASCDDPHGVPSNGKGSVFNPSFMRVSNNDSALCLTCRTK